MAALRLTSHEADALASRVGPCWERDGDRGRPSARRRVAPAWRAHQRRRGRNRARQDAMSEPASLSKEVDVRGRAEPPAGPDPAEPGRDSPRPSRAGPRTKDRETVRADAVRRQHLHRADHALQDAAAWRSAPVAEEWLARHARLGEPGSGSAGGCGARHGSVQPRARATLALALTSYGPMLRLALSYAEDGRPASRELLHGVARSIGLELPCSCAPVSSSTTSPPATTPSRSCHSSGCLARASRSSWRRPIRRRCHGCQWCPWMSSTPATTMRPTNGWAASSEDLPHRVEECTDGD